MKKIVSLISMLLFSCLLSTAALASQTISYKVDFSKVNTVYGSSNIDWNAYTDWYMSAQVETLGYSWRDSNGIGGYALPFKYTNGVPLKTFTQAPYVLANTLITTGVSTLNVGVTKGINFVAMTPASCLVKLKNGDTLYVSGTLHIPGNLQDPYLENVACKLNK